MCFTGVSCRGSRKRQPSLSRSGGEKTASVLVDAWVDKMEFLFALHQEAQAAGTIPSQRDQEAYSEPEALVDLLAGPSTNDEVRLRVEGIRSLRLQV